MSDVKAELEEIQEVRAELARAKERVRLLEQELSSEEKKRIMLWWKLRELETAAKTGDGNDE